MIQLIKNFFRLRKTDLTQNEKCINYNLELENIKLQNGKLWTALLQQNIELKTIADSEFKVFSQWGDDGIIQYLINYLNIENKTFIEFGVEDYLESNTRFLLINNNWTGLVMDSDENNIKKIINSELYWKNDLIAKKAFITSENINQLIQEEGIVGRIGLLHIDIDGNDYWVWKALKIVEPIIMIVEYNSVFGPDRAITIPYKEDFSRTSAHYSNLYAGSSILSLCDLAKEKGYSFIGCNSAGNNSYFVKNEFLKDLTPLTAEQGFIESKFRESRNDNNELTFLRKAERIEMIRGLQVFNTRLNKIEKL